MNDYPNSDEEFELMYGDELQIINEQEDEELESHTAGPSSRRSLNFNSPVVKPISAKLDSKQCSSKQISVLENSFERDFQKLNDGDTNHKKIGIEDRFGDTNHKKRGIEDLFGDIDDIIEEEHRKLPKKSKNETELTERILEQKKLNAAKQNPSLNIGTRKVLSIEHIKNNISIAVPRYPFIGATRHDGERIYIRMHNEEYEKENIGRVCKDNSYHDLMAGNSAELWEEANKLMNKRLDPSLTQNDVNIEETNNSKLWVDLYKPRKYNELLSDAATSRILLTWLILWDKIVFHRKPIVPRNKLQTNTQINHFQKKELDLTLDEHGRPLNKVALLCGAPGLGKTTLANLVAKHCGYNVVEINASDERNVENFKKALENATQMKSVLDKSNRPNCLVFDEIDGAPSGAIEFLIKFINGTTKNKRKNILKRPIICICNDAYVPALRPLRQIALILNFPPTSNTRLAERLLDISRYQNIKTDMATMLALSKKSNNDIRSCLSVLNFFKSKNKPVTLSEINKTQIGQKDIQKGLFSVWSEIFELKYIPGHNKQSNMTDRMKNVLETVLSFGDYDRLMQGVFENYPKHETNFYSICEAMEWFGFSDLLNKKISETQNYSIGSYLPFGFVVWHFAFSSYQKKRIMYPSVDYEVATKQAHQTAIISEILRGMPPNLRVYVSSNALRLDIIPMFAHILVPNLRTINVSLYAPQEKEQIANVVQIMIDYNLTYVQERNVEGSYNYYMDPNIEEIYSFEELKTNRKTLSYTSKQMLAREIELEKMRKLEKSLHKNSKKEKQPIINERKEKLKIVDQENTITLKEKLSPKVPNHLQRLSAKTVKPQKVIVADFFGRKIDVTTLDPKTEENSARTLSGDIWYDFKEGYSNAAKKSLTMEELLQNN